MEFVRHALELLRGEFPVAYFAICSAIAGRSIAIRVEAEEMFIVCRPFELLLAPAVVRPDIQVSTDRATILRIIDAEQTLEEAVTWGQLFVSGKRTDLGACHEALLTFVRGAVRSPSFPFLLEEFRRFVEEHRGAPVGT